MSRELSSFEAFGAHITRIEHISHARSIGRPRSAFEGREKTANDSAFYPPLRGTAIEIDEDRAILYSRGAVDFFQTYPGMYVPRPIDIVAEDSDRSISAITKEVLALTKMNWNNTEFDNSMPITVQAARRVGRILKYLGPTDRANPLYSFYM